MSSISEEYIGGIVDKIAGKYNLSNYEYSFKKFEIIAQNFFGVLIPITLKGTTNEVTLTMELVLKLAPTDERYRVSGAVTLMFAREIYIYSELLVKYSEIQKRFHPELKYLMPKCYHICKDYCGEAIALENMCSIGYEPFVSSNFLDYYHTVLSLEALAKFHALSFILKEKNPTQFEKVTKLCEPFTQESNSRFMFIILDRLQKAIDKFENTVYKGLLKYLKDHCVELVEAAALSVTQQCICHGDIWKENILFNYNENREPISACLIDYQTVRISSAAYDTLFLITTSTNKSLRGNPDTNFNKLLDIYFHKFENTLQAAGLDSENIYLRKLFDEDMKIVAPACFIIANTALWLSSGLQEEGHVRSKQVFTSQLEREEAIQSYRNRIKEIINDYISYGYFNSIESYKIVN